MPKKNQDNLSLLDYLKLNMERYYLGIVLE